MYRVSKRIDIKQLAASLEQVTLMRATRNRDVVKAKRSAVT